MVLQFKESSNNNLEKGETFVSSFFSMKKLILIFLFSPILYGQQDSIQEVGEVIVNQTVFQYSRNSSMNANEIEELSPVDIGDVLMKISGVNLKSYGSLGGLKTVSMRGLGTNHSAIVKDGFVINNTQTGQVNLGQIEVDNVVGVVSSVGERYATILPISAQISGSTFLLKTFENTFSSDTLQIRSSVKYGSFNQQFAYLGAKYQPNNWFFSATGSFRKSDGNYDYAYKNGSIHVEDERLNNDYQDFNVGVSIGHKWKSNSFRLGYKHTEIDQGLPGAVILYNATQDERMTTNDHSFFGDINLNGKKSILRIYANGRLNDLRYTDPTFLNTSGGIDVTYFNRNITGGISIATDPKRHVTFNGGTEFILSDLTENGDNFDHPTRLHNVSLLGTCFKAESFKIITQLSSQLILEDNPNGLSGANHFRVNPFVSIEQQGNGKMKLKQSLWYRNSFRMPSFNELYYNNIGNNLLKPEDANQLNYGVSFKPIDEKLSIFVRSNVYFNRVKNKIVAIPTKNLFVWSMQNVGTTNIYGFEIILDANYQLAKNWKSTITGNYSYQRTIDVTDKDSPTYKNQIAYIPLHTVNLDLQLDYRKTGIRFSNYYISERYSLNENVIANRVEEFLISDLTVFYRFQLKNGHKLKVQFTAKNIFDQSYSYIRSFAMPGRNYLISIHYAFN